MKPEREAADYDTDAENILTTEAEATDSDVYESGQEMTTLTAEQLQQILGAMVKAGSFTQCTSRFRGQRDPAAVEEILAAIRVYKNIEKITDGDALRGMPLLLEDYAASWWMGVKEQVTTFKEALDLIRNTFSPPIPDWRIISSIFETKQQKAEPTDSFICKKRLLFSQLKVPISEEVHLNMVYGLLTVQIRERVRRESITKFEMVITASREAEMCLAETRPSSAAESKKAEQNAERCTYCRHGGHSAENCYKN